MATVKDVSCFFIDYGEKSGEPMTNMRLNKMLYFAQGVYLARYEALLFDDDIEAWQFGPVVSDVYHTYKRFKELPITDPEAGFFRDQFSDEEYTTLLDVVRFYGDYTTHALVNISHRPGGAWEQTMETTEKIIPVELIKAEFSGTDSPQPFVFPVEAFEIIDRQNTDGLLILPEDEEEEWPEYNAI